MLDELPVLVDEYLLDEVGVVGEEDALRPEPGRYQVAMIAGPAASVPRRSAVNSFRSPPIPDPMGRADAARRAACADRRVSRGHREPPGR